MVGKNEDDSSDFARTRGNFDQFDATSERSANTADIDKPMTAEEQRLAEEIINEQKIDAELQEDATTRAALLTSPLLLAASTEVLSSNGYAQSYNNDVSSRSIGLSDLNEEKQENFEDDLESDDTDRSFTPGDLHFRKKEPSQIDFNASDAFLGEIEKEEEVRSGQKKRINQIICLVAVVVIALVVVLIVVLINKGNDANPKASQSISSQPSISPYPTITPSPSLNPTATRQPTIEPTSSPSITSPSNQPSLLSSSLPSSPPRNTAAPVEVTTEVPTSRVTSTPSSKPSGQQSSIPTRQPAVQPFMPPSEGTPRPVFFSPTLSPSLSNEEEERRAEIEARILPVSGLLALEDKNSPQYMAFDWLCKEDPLELPGSDKGILQRYILALLYFSTDGDNWNKCGSPKGETPCSDHMKRYLSGATTCRWMGISCDIYEQIEGINLRENGLRGELPPELGELTELSALSLSRNNLNGSIPNRLSRLRHLKYLLLNNNEFNGEVPTFIGQLNSIWYLHLGSNLFSGTIPSEIFAPTLQHLDMSENRLVGTIPEEIYTVSEDLRQIDLSNNGLGGPIPAGLGDFPSLTTFAARNNTLTGSLPGKIITDTLTTLDLGRNTLNGVIPPELYMFGTSLTFIHLGLNDFTGTIPARLGDLTSLRTLVLFFNQLSGAIPQELSGLSSIEVLHLAGNSLEGTVSSEICELRSRALSALTSDCGGDDPAVECSCCTYCVGGRR